MFCNSCNIFKVNSFALFFHMIPGFFFFAKGFFGDTNINFIFLHLIFFISDLHNSKQMLLTTHQCCVLSCKTQS